MIAAGRVVLDHGDLLDPGLVGKHLHFAGALLFLLSRASDFCTGHVLYVDGGYTAG